MAARWSTEHRVSEYKDLQANTMSLDSTGQLALLAGRKYLAVINLDRPSIPLKKVFRQSKWEVAAAEWSPHHKQLFSLASNQRAEILEWKDGELVQLHTLKGHTRAISDLNWSVFDPNILATASIDTFIYLWDIRDLRKPSLCFQAVAGATQVKWNKVTPSMLATSHDGDVRLWDPRKGTTPLQYITAHLSKIHGLDWSPTQEHQLATSSQDGSVKFWDVTSPRKVDYSLNPGFPVWRARYTPFGEGIVTVVVPQLRRGENSLILWNMTELGSPAHTFVGHSDVVLEFGWRKRTEDSRDYHLVTWAKDQSLRIWTIDSQLQKLCGHEAAPEVEEGELLGAAGGADSPEITDTTSQASHTSPRETDYGGQSSPPRPSMQSGAESGSRDTSPTSTPPSSLMSQPQNLQQEFSLVNINIPSVTINEGPFMLLIDMVNYGRLVIVETERKITQNVSDSRGDRRLLSPRMNASKRTCTVTAVSGKHAVYVKLRFPSSYPCNAPPTFYICPGTTVPSNVKTKILKALRTTSQQQVKRNRSCLEPCLRQLVNTLEKCTKEGNHSAEAGSDTLETHKPTAVYGSFEDSSVPFPRTSGARFCGPDILVCFVRPPHLQRMSAPTEVTPRSLSALGAYLSSHVLPASTASSASPAACAMLFPQSPSGDTSVSISSFYYQERKQRRRYKSRHMSKDRQSTGATPKQPSNCGAVLVFSAANLMPVDKTLAENYVLDEDDVVGMCTKNASLAASIGRKDLVQVWSLVSLSLSPLLAPDPNPDAGMPWAQHQFGQRMIQSLIKHYISIYDVQTVAMLCCVFSQKSEDVMKNKKPASEIGSASPGGSPYHTVVPTDTTVEGGWNFVNSLKRNRSNSWSDSVEEFRYAEAFGEPQDMEKEKHEVNIRMLDPKLSAQYDQFKKSYANILFQWNMLKQRAQILKYVPSAIEKHRGVEFIIACQHCNRDGTNPFCSGCKKYNFECIICHIAVKGSSIFCFACGHGGHSNHMLEWFQDMDVCPTGCGCACLQQSDIFGPT